jgi:hypothetical protein
MAGQGVAGYSIGIGGCAGMVCASVDSDSPTETQVDLTSPTLGAGIKLCAKNRGNGNSDPCDKNKENNSLGDNGETVTFGLGRNLGISFSKEKTCINVGPSIGLPVTVSGSNGTISHPR